MAELQDFQKRVIAHAQGVTGLSAGEKAPDFTLPNARGERISLADCLKKSPVVLKVLERISNA